MQVIVAICFSGILAAPRERNVGWSRKHFLKRLGSNACARLSGPVVDDARGEDRLPLPPETVTIATRSLAGRVPTTQLRAMSKNSSMLSARYTPNWRKSESYTASSPARAAVCEAAAALRLVAPPSRM